MKILPCDNHISHWYGARLFKYKNRSSIPVMKETYQEIDI